MLRKGYKFNGSTFDLYYPLPSELNPSAKVAYEHNIFGVIRQVMYSKVNTNEIDFVVFINGLPLATFWVEEQLYRSDLRECNHAVSYRKQEDPQGEGEGEGYLATLSSVGCGQDVVPCNEDVTHRQKVPHSTQCGKWQVEQHHLAGLLRVLSGRSNTSSMPCWSRNC